MTSTTYPDILTQFTPISLNVKDNVTVVPIANIPVVDPKEPTDQQIVCANVGVNPIVAHPGEIQNEIMKSRRRTFEPVALRRNNGPLIINDKRWYFRLVSAKQGEYRRARALMDDFSLNEISHHMIVCFTPDYLPGNGRPFRNKDGNPIRIYAFFDSYLEFYDYMQRFPPHERAFYEIIFGELPQKPHFDIDISMKDLVSLYPNEDIDTVAEILREYVISGCIEVLAENMVTLDMNKDVLLYSSHGEDKRSYHLILNNKCHDGNKEAKAFYEAVMGKVRIYTRGKYIEFVDKSVYSPRQQFRMVGCQKQGSNRPKVFYEQYWYQGQQYTHIYNEDVADLTMKKLTIIYESMVSFTSGCVFLPSLIPPTPINQNHLGDMPDLDRNIVEHCMSMLRDKMEYCPFSVKEVIGHLILLKRNAPSHCPICRKPEPHEHENPFMFIVGGKVYWDCRRCHDDAKRMFVGYLAMSIEELQTGATFPGFTPNEGVEIDEYNDSGGEFMFGDYNIGLPTLPPLKTTTLNEIKGNSPPQTTQRVLTQDNPTIIPTNNLHVGLQPIPKSQIDQALLNLPPEKRIQHVQATTMRIAKEWAQKKYIRREPEDLMGIRSLSSVSTAISWIPGMK